MQPFQRPITIEGVTYSVAQFLQPLDFARRSQFHQQLYDFLKEWYQEQQQITLFTSGSTGMPKTWQATKQQMLNSARMTCDFLQLTQGDKILLCLPLDYIAGKMMVVRALLAGLDIYLATPDGQPLANVELPLAFAAMVPLQVFNSLKQPEQALRLQHIDKLIIGGGAIDHELAERLATLPNQIYSTYGMTETLSHIALRRLNGPMASDRYQPFPNVRLSLSSEETLVIDAPFVCPQTLITNDRAMIDPDGCFTILGRSDNVINSGGVKIQIEELEQKLQPCFQRHFAISACPDKKFGEIIVLITEQIVELDQLNSILSIFERPKKIMIVESVPLTRSGKVNRAEVKKMVTDWCDLLN